MEALGLDVKAFLFQLANFAVLIGGLTYLLHKPLLKLIDSRNKEIGESLKNAAKMKKEVAETEVRQRALLAEARGEANQLIEAAKSQSEALATRIQEDAQAKAEALLTRAEAEISAERERIKEELRAELAELIVDASGRLVRSEIPAEAKAAQIRRLTGELSKPVTRKRGATHV